MSSEEQQPAGGANRGLPELPEDPEPGRYRCPDCGLSITVNSSGREIGHANYETARVETCERRNGGDSR